MKTVLVSLSAKNIHKSLAAWCLKSYCESKGSCDIEIVEANINNNIGEIIGKVFECKPDIIGFSCYIWNIDYVKKIGSAINKLLPKAVIVLGGPEVSFEQNLHDFPFANCIVRGEGEGVFWQLLDTLQRGKSVPDKIIDGDESGFKNNPTPFSDAYFASFAKRQLPIGNQLVYYESSRGCPFSCSYCLSSSFLGVQFLDLERVKQDLLRLVQNGAKCIKFVDRTFNADRKRAENILSFILTLDTDCTFHFEAAADLFDNQLLSIIEKMPAGRVQFEIGIQSTNEQVLEAVNRKTNTGLVLKNIQKLIDFENCHIHIDLIAGLPFETFETFKQAINQCVVLNPHMLQLGFLKMLKGTKIRQTCNMFGAVFADFAPYEIFCTSTISFEEILELKKIESVIEKFFNSGAYAHSLKYGMTLFDTPYDFFKNLSSFCPDALNLNMSLKNCFTLLFNFLSKHGDKATAEHCVKLDCLSLDSRGLLPDEIKPMRSKQAEAQFRLKSGKKSANIRIEFFAFDGKYRLFDYDNKNLLKNRFEVEEICVDV